MENQENYNIGQQVIYFSSTKPAQLLKIKSITKAGFIKLENGLYFYKTGEPRSKAASFGTIKPFTQKLWNTTFKNYQRFGLWGY